MSTRWPPVVGVTGFDGGSKPAISLAIRPIESKAEEEEILGGVNPQPGACCYDDGTCDDLLEFDCIAAGGEFQGEGTSCDDDPPPCVGACCEPGCVENTTPDGCAADGGTFQGFGTTCDPDPCELCPSITLTCDSIAASKSKCGYTYQCTDGVLFYPTNRIDSLCGEGAGCVGTPIDPDIVWRTLTHHTYCGSCFGPPDCSGDYNEVHHKNGDCEDVVECTCDITHEGETCTCDNLLDPCGPASTHLVFDITVSDPYTDDALCDEAVALLPAYDDDFNDDCDEGASRFVSEDGSSCSIRRFRPKFQFTEPGVSETDVVLCYNEHFVPDEGDPVDTPKTATILAGDTFVIGDEVLEPSENGVITITDIRCCFEDDE